MTAAVQTIWCELVIGTLADAGVSTCIVSPGSRSTPLIAALARLPRVEVVTVIDERAAAFFALGQARATGVPVALVCTSGTAAAHYLPALIEASLAGVPLIAITADRPPELHGCGASQTIEQVGLYGRYVRAAFDLGAPVASVSSLRAIRRTVIQAVTLARGPDAGPVHLEVPLRKPLEPAAPSTDDERALERTAHALRGAVTLAPPSLAVDPAALDALAAAIAGEPDGVIVAGALPVGFAAARAAVFELAVRAGYPVIAEAGSQLRFGPRPADVTVLDHHDLIPLGDRPMPRMIVQLGAAPVAASWPGWLAALTADDVARPPERWVLAGARWHDPEATARGVLLGDPAAAIAGLRDRVRVLRDAEELDAGRASRRIRTSAWVDTWRGLDARARLAVDAAIEHHARNEAAVMRAAIDAVPAGGTIQIGNSLPIRVVDQACAGGTDRRVVTQRGAAGIDGLIASAAGATRAGAPVLLILGDVSFAHDLGGLHAARRAAAPLTIVVIDNRGGQIFAGLPVARAGLGLAFERDFLTPPELDPTAIATALGARAITAASPAAVATAVRDGLTTPGVTVIVAPVTSAGAHDVRRTAIDLFAAPTERAARGETP